MLIAHQCLAIQAFAWYELSRSVQKRQAASEFGHAEAATAQMRQVDDRKGSHLDCRELALDLAQLGSQRLLCRGVALQGAA